MIALALLVAIAVLIDAVICAPEGVQTDSGFAITPGFAGEQLPETTVSAKSERNPLGAISVAASAGSYHAN